MCVEGGVENYGSKTMDSDEPTVMTNSHLHVPVAVKKPQQFASCVHFSAMTHSADVYISEFWEVFLLGSMPTLWTYWKCSTLGCAKNRAQQAGAGALVPGRQSGLKPTPGRLLSSSSRQ